ncbi:hypothetical protein [Desulfobotulus sp.]|jgi:hypothetical protein|uniref:hypothetical protein n=1 Tax=Desulfobotulus sp. TaxID=1940337 RepID=UPI002A36B89A|nr:hypothetical protein [Desulfobotulus sp.]MDY0164652.1 hypothetical protein [Desulfobotulus sp.]
MTTIPNLNLVVQQGGAVREAHNLKAQPYDSAQAAQSVQPEREAQRREQVQLSEEASLRAGKDGKKDKEQEGRSPDRKAQKEADSMPDGETPDGRGRLLDTRA